MIIISTANQLYELLTTLNWSNQLNLIKYINFYCNISLSPKYFLISKYSVSANTASSILSMRLIPSHPMTNRIVNDYINFLKRHDCFFRVFNFEAY